MTAIASLSDLVNLMSGGNSGTPENLWWHKTSRYNGGSTISGVPIAGRPYSLWQIDGHPAAGSAPTTWANPDNTTAGGLLQADPGGGRQKWLASFGATGLNIGTLMLYDRLGHNGNLDGNSASTQSFTGSLTRYTDGIGNIMWYEIYGNTTTIIGATGRTVSVTYTNTTPTGSRTSSSVTIGGTGFREGNQARFLPLQSGDKGIVSVESATLSAGTGTTGAWGITVAHPLATIVIGAAGIMGWRDFATGLPGLPEIKTDACLALLWIPNSTSVPELFGCVSSVEK